MRTDVFGDELKNLIRNKNMRRSRFGFKNRQPGLVGGRLDFNHHSHLETARKPLFAPFEVLWSHIARHDDLLVRVHERVEGVEELLLELLLVRNELNVIQ